MREGKKGVTIWNNFFAEGKCKCTYTCIASETFLVFDPKCLPTIHALCFVTANYINFELKMTEIVSNLKHFCTNHFGGEKFVVFFRQVLLS